MFLRNSAKARADQERSRRLRGRHATRRRLGEEHPSHQPGVLGSFLGVKAAARSAARALTPIHPTVPLRPLRGPLARFSSGGRVKGLVVARSRRGEDTAP